MRGVNCRIGSLEMSSVQVTANVRVNCRIGSLERHSCHRLHVPYVNCRIGSLETFSFRFNACITS